MQEPDLSPLRDYVRRTWPSSLSDTERVRLIEVHRAVAGAAERVERDSDGALFETLPRAWIERDDAGDLAGIAGLSRLPTRHALHGLPAPRFAWCAFDCLFLPAVLDAALEAASCCPVTGAAIRLRIDPLGVRSVTPERVRIVFATPPPERFGRALRSAFCEQVRFCLAEAAAQWADGGADRVSLSLEQGSELAAVRNSVVFGDALSGSR